MKVKFQQRAIDAIQDVCEAYLQGLFEDANHCAHHAGRVTVLKKDFDLALRLRGDEMKDLLSRRQNQDEMFDTPLHEQVGPDEEAANLQCL